MQALTKPTLCVGGRLDPVAQPQLVQETAALIPGAELFIFEEAGHYPFAECTDEFNHVLFEFLDRCGLSLSKSWVDLGTARPAMAC